jgi:hypothetical protein
MGAAGYELFSTSDMATNLHSKFHIVFVRDKKNLTFEYTSISTPTVRDMVNTTLGKYKNK